MNDLIDRNAVMLRVREFIGNPTYNENMLVNDLNALPSAEPESKWIPVTERLPEDSERVLITHKAGVSTGWYNGIYWERGAHTKHKPLQTVIAWMPLPEPYGGD